MGKLVRLLGSGIGMASEAIHDYRARSQSGRSSPNPAAGPSSGAAAYYSDAPPGYADVDDATAERLVRSGRAEVVAGSAYQSEKSKAAEAGYSDEDDSSSDDDDSDGGRAAGADEAVWELDDMAEYVAPAAYRTESPPPGYEDAVSEEAMIKKEEAMIRDLVRMAGPPPRPVQRIPCPVIIPQRRPRNKERGFVRAYAPVLEDCGVSQDVFLKFLKDWLVASKVCRSPIAIIKGLHYVDTATGMLVGPLD